MTETLVKMHKPFILDLSLVGRHIKTARLDLGLTQQQAADRTEISPQYWGSIERGKEQGSVVTYLQIAAALDLSLDDLFYDDAEAMRVSKRLSHDGILSNDYSVSEKAIISDVILALKSSLGRNRGR